MISPEPHQFIIKRIHASCINCICSRSDFGLVCVRNMASGICLPDKNQSIAVDIKWVDSNYYCVVNCGFPIYKGSEFKFG
jgi:hypothetical protein